MNVREINVSLIETTIEKMCIDANYYLNKDIKDALVKSSLVEASPLGKSILNDILENAKLAEEKMFLCAKILVWQLFLLP
jgi:Tartrate dehydratase alpha subunit/Fumarate hydratase class I, N-terminal domain